MDSGGGGGGGGGGGAVVWCSIIYIMKSQAKIVTACQQSNNFVKYHQSIRYLHRTHCLQLSDLTKTNIFTAINL